VTGWVFLASASLSILVVSHSPHGMEEVQRLIASGIYGATSSEVVEFGLLLVGVGAFLLVARRRLLLLTDEEMAQAVGIRPGPWNVGLACLLGVTVGLSLRTVGMLYTFGCLVLPCLGARNLCRRASTVLFLALALGLGSSVAAFVLANAWNQPPGQVAVATLAAVVAATSLVRRVRGA
jgi:ABC-type Mn2+/Zn2+ transport system permease subunit